MCGIIGYVGAGHAVEAILSGLQRLEYRGYDSAGLAICPPKGGLLRVRVAGKVAALRSACASGLPADVAESGRCAIGHTRWATHGAPTEANAHPHFSRNGRIAVVHNGIIENYRELKEHLARQGFVFSSETDTEVLPHLIEACYEGDLRRAVAAALDRVEGTYGLAVISDLYPDRIIVARKGSPLAIGVGEGETLVASDVSALVSHTRQVVFLQDEDLAEISPDSYNIVSLRNVPVSRETIRIDWLPDRVEKGGCEHFMLKEIREQPEALANTLRGRLVEKEGTVKLSGLRMSPADLARIERIVVAACGTSLYAGTVGKYLFEEFADLPTDIEQAAEFRYRNPIIQRDSCLIAISQSGETADTLEAVREGMRKGATVLGICNVVGSTIARECARGLFLHAGPEIGVASTKAFTCQVAVLAMLAIAFGRARRLSMDEGARRVAALSRVPDLARAVLEREDAIRKIAEKYAHAEHCFFLGRGIMMPVACEGALKLKEISYIHAEGYHAAELKHGPIALLDPKVPVVVAVPNLPGKIKTIANMQECRARGAPVIALATEGDAEVRAHADDVIELPPCEAFVSPIPVVVAEQLFAYYVARARGCPIDQPRNLAKSVTVE